MKILFISNGHGEDLIAARIITELKGQEISALPIVGSGLPYENTEGKILGARKALPSGGFIYQSFSNIIKDFASGLGKNTIDQIKLLRRQKGKFDIVVCVGDIVPVIGALFTGIPFVFMGSAKSDYYDYSYTPWEKFILKRYCLMSFLRDQKTADNFVKAGIKAIYAGNPMMDCLDITGEDFGIEKETKVIGILPGSRQDARMNLEDILPAVKELNKLAAQNGIKTAYLVSVAPTLNAQELELGQDLILSKKFGDILNRSDIVIGLTGTANEQAAGMGKPVVAFAGRGVQYTASFAKRQTQLLGKALSVVKREPSVIAAKIMDILLDKDLYKSMSEAGVERVRGKGAGKKIADYVLGLKKAAK